MNTFSPLNKKHLFEYDFDLFGFVGSFAIARTWTWCKLSEDKTERETFLFKFCMIEKKYESGMIGLALSVVFIPFMFIIGRAK